MTESCVNLTEQEKEMIRFCSKLHIDNYGIIFQKVTRLFDYISLTTTILLGFMSILVTALVTRDLSLTILVGIFFLLIFIVIDKKILPMFNEKYGLVVYNWVKLFETYNLKCKHLYGLLEKRNLCKEDQEILNFYRHVIFED